MLTYDYDPAVIRIAESQNEDDTEFQIRIMQEQPYWEAMKRVQKTFDEDRHYTDVLFYVYPEHEYKVIVRREHYADFVLELIKRRLLRKVEWA
ncbi:MAG: hypothetical protein J7639_12695 [Paenibacillaceae bacterium]|nr:hypothetical protein [Paenibacillaceae bacterium]